LCGFECGKAATPGVDAMASEFLRLQNASWESTPHATPLRRWPGSAHAMPIAALFAVIPPTSEMDGRWRWDRLALDDRARRSPSKTRGVVPMRCTLPG
jgi:hypothetical protein